MKVEINLEKLDEKFVITKQFAGNKYFTRKSYSRLGYKCDSQRSCDSVIFDTKEEAEKLCATFNIGRQKVKHKVEPASRYFCSKVEFYNNKSWYGPTTFEVTNAYVPIEDVAKRLKGAKKSSLQQKQNFIEACMDAIKDLEVIEQKIETDFQKQLEDLKVAKQFALDQRRAQLMEAEAAMIQAKELDYEELSQSIETEQDKKFRVLFGGLE